MDKKPFFSICIPTYNRRELLQNTLDSVFNQTFQDYEIIIFDDCSLDDTQKYCEGLVKKNKKLKYYRNEKNVGFVNNLKKTINKAKGGFIFLLGNDDVIVPSCLEEYHKALSDQKNNIGACRANVFAFFQPQKENLFKIFLNLQDKSLKPKSYQNILDYYATFISGWAIRNKKPLAVGDGHQDAFIETVFQQIKDSNFYYIPKVLIGQGVSNNLGYSFYGFTSPWFELDKLMRKYEDKKNLENSIKSVKYQMVNDCHNIKIYGGRAKLMAHLVWFFSQPIPEREQFRFLLKSIFVLIMPNSLLKSLRKIQQNVSLVRNRNKFNIIWK